MCALAPWRHPDAGRDPYFLVLYECEDRSLPDPTGLTVADTTTWEFRKHQQPRLEALKDTNPRLPRRHPDNLRVLIAFWRRSQQRYDRFGSALWRELGEPRYDNACSFFYSTRGEVE